MSKEQSNQKDDKALHIGSVVSGYLIRFNEVDEWGNMFLPNLVNLDSLNQMKISGKIKDYEIDNKGVKVIKDFKIDSASI